MPTSARQRKIAEVVSSRQEGIVVLEDIHDPHNAEAVFRSCEAFGFQQVYLIFEQEERFNPKKIGKATSSSANKWLDFSLYNSTEACLRGLKKEGYQIIATVLDEKAENLFSTQIKESKIALLLGNEHRGLSEKALSLADRRIIIPMRGMVQSLNLSVTAAIFLYEITRQRLAYGMENYLLPSERQHQLEKDFLRR
jgi:tRNA (guanosine-2'-O-)-methyltransferase